MRGILAVTAVDRVEVCNGYPSTVDIPGVPVLGSVRRTRKPLSPHENVPHAGGVIFHSGRNGGGNVHSRRNGGVHVLEWIVCDYTECQNNTHGDTNEIVPFPRNGAHETKWQTRPERHGHRHNASTCKSWDFSSPVQRVSPSRRAAVPPGIRGRPFTRERQRVCGSHIKGVSQPSSTASRSRECRTPAGLLSPHHWVSREGEALPRTK